MGLKGSNYSSPYGSIVAYDLNKGDIIWNIPNGDTPDKVKNHPALAEVDLPEPANDPMQRYWLLSPCCFTAREEEAIRSCMRSTNSLGKKWE